MFVRMATHAIVREPEVRAVQIFDEDAGPRRGGNMRSIMAIAAPHARVFPGERETGLAVIDGLPNGLPMNQRKVLPVVFGMAADAILAVRIRREPVCVHSMTLRQAITNLDVTLQTFELGAAAAEFVAFRAAQGTGERFMRLRERPRRDLRAGGNRAQACEKETGQSERGPERKLG